MALAHKVESVVFRDPKFPKGQISINAEEGEVFLRGQVDRRELIHDLEEAVPRSPAFAVWRTSSTCRARRRRRVTPAGAYAEMRAQPDDWADVDVSRG